jgi:cyclase
MFGLSGSGESGETYKVNRSEQLRSNILTEANYLRKELLMKFVNKRILIAIAVFGFVIVAPRAGSAQGIAASDYAITKLNDNLYFIGAATKPINREGGNNLLLIGENYALLVDGDSATNVEVLRQVIRSVTDKPIRLVINTHYHYDHVNANESFAKDGAVIVAHENVRRRMSEDIVSEDTGTTFPAAPLAARPTVTFLRQQSFFLAGERIDAKHEVAHTDTDSVLYLREANVVHTGDVFFNHMFPFIDRATGGGIDKMIRATKEIIREIDDQTVVVPGHGDLANKQALVEYLRMLETARHRINALIRNGLSQEQVIAAKPLAEYDATWSWAFLNGDLFTYLVYKSLAN